MASPSAFIAGLTGRCPACGKGRLFAGLLALVPACGNCDLAFADKEDSGDGPAYFALLIVGTLAMALAAVTELKFSPPLWVHAVLWIPFTLVGCVLCMRFFKAWLIAVQYKNNLGSFEKL